MPSFLLVLNHLLQFFVLPVALAALVCAGTQLVFRRHAKASALSWTRRWLRSSGVACAYTALAIVVFQGQSTMTFYALLLVAISASEAYWLRLWQA